MQRWDLHHKSWRCHGVKHYLDGSDNENCNTYLTKIFYVSVDTSGVTNIKNLLLIEYQPGKNFRFE